MTKRNTCNGLRCIEYLTYAKETLPCTLYTVHEGINLIMNITIYPVQEFENIKVENNSTSGFKLLWNFLIMCKELVEDNYLVQVKIQNHTIKATSRNIMCNAISCIEHLTYANITPCSVYTTYDVRQKERLNISTPLDIRQLQVENVSSSQFQLSWEILAICQNMVKSDTVKVKNNNQLITMTTKTEICNVTQCNVSLKYSNDITSCTDYTVYVDKDHRMNITTFPGTLN